MRTLAWLSVALLALVAVGCEHVCTPENCTDGCCSNDTCYVGQTRDLCGKGGKACVDCGDLDSCSSAGLCTGRDRRPDGSKCAPEYEACNQDSDCCKSTDYCRAYRGQTDRQCLSCDSFKYNSCLTSADCCPTLSCVAPYTGATSLDCE